MRKVFFVDDEPLIAQGLTSIIEWSQYQLKIAGSANDGLQALEKLKEESVDLLITDIMMPRMNGLELIKKVKEMHPRTKFIVLSGYEEFEYVKVGITLGIQNYLLKPINIDELEATIKHIRGDWEREELKLFRSEEDWKVLRSNVLQRWVNGEIETHEFRQRAELLGIPMNYSFYHVAVLRLISDDKPVSQLYRLTGLADEFSQIAAQVLVEGQEVICFPDVDDDIVVLFASMEVHNAVVQESLTAVMQRLHDMTTLRLWCSEGHTNDFKGVQEGYRAAKGQLARSFIAREGDIFYSLADAQGDTEIPLEPLNQEQMNKLLVEGSEHTLKAYIESLLASPGDDQAVCRAPYINTAIQLMLTVKDMERNPDYSEVFAPLPRISTMLGLQQHVWATIARSLELQRQNEAGYSAHVSFLIEQVQYHYAEELSLKTLSQRLKLHPNYLGQLFQQEVGSSFSDYVNQYRIEKATQLLLHTEQKTAEIAVNVGYIDSSYFYRQFKKYAGVSPTELRTMYAK
ncbi:response regulator transcription factor [Paenibacillus fonticola]|uniref:response regulator transcription factor n=1 Tax=Paenibacillus fonticola TaxID=379896 RepID=UPI0003822781|nr:response regulator transcription factor [Paenibacillus fonticola]